MRTYFHVKGGRLEEVKGEVVREQPLTVYVNGERFLTLLCSPFQLDALVVGYLWMEKVVEDLAEITRLEISEVDGRADVTLVASGDAAHRAHPHLGLRRRHHVPHRPAPLPAAALLAAGDARGSSRARIKELYGQAERYQASRGIHGAALADGERLLVMAEDVGRHNAVDKVKGEALLKGITTVDRILLSTGRVSSEMLLKAARMGVPVVASRTSPTEMAVGLAEQLGITVIGYLRPDGLNLYAGDALDRRLTPCPTTPR